MCIPPVNTTDDRTSKPVIIVPKDDETRMIGLSQYESSLGIFGEPCGKCGATVFLWKTDREGDEPDMAPGLLDELQESMATVEVVAYRESVQLPGGTQDPKNETQSSAPNDAVVMIAEGVAITQQAPRGVVTSVAVVQQEMLAPLQANEKAESTAESEEVESEEESDADFPQWNGPRARGKQVANVSGKKSDKEEKKKKDQDKGKDKKDKDPKGAGGAASSTSKKMPVSS
ncbi:hypothetical protein NLJ89_g937 [Agrocybe chaxingu]|uniref:Uncharacterized protein n=1 Tax=Agrocybe chaxingu TaxID=84603 RepID=A0A9W8N133_9AGAR|nr:hypothetical protein NLJ89_g937 [Agrocybe chaxingu]